MRIVLLGAPGAGKGTQAKRLTEALDMTHLSSGDILRAEKASGSDLGVKLAEYMDVGELVPDEVVVGVMAKAVGAAATGGVLLDGFPRTLAQAQALDGQLDRLHLPLDLVIVIDVDEQAVVDRICGRRNCPQCGAIYHVRYLRPKVDGACDECSYRGPLAQRDDDKEDVVRTRLEAYNELTAPLLDYYKGTCAEKVLMVDGNRGAGEVAEDLLGRLRVRPE